jgi:hypothetical protein
MAGIATDDGSDNTQRGEEAETGVTSAPSIARYRAGSHPAIADGDATAAISAAIPHDPLPPFLRAQWFFFFSSVPAPSLGFTKAAPSTS